MEDPFLIYDPAKCRSAARRDIMQRPCDKCRRMKVKCHPGAALAPSKQSDRGETHCVRCRRKGVFCTFDGLIINSQKNPKSKIARPQDLLDTTPADSEISFNLSESYDNLRDDLGTGLDGNGSMIEPTIWGSPEIFLAHTNYFEHSSSAQHMVLSNAELHRGVDEFINATYLILPVIDRDELLEITSRNTCVSEIELRTLLHAISMLNSISGAQMTPSEENKSLARRLITTVERMRLDYDFAENPTLNTVVIPLLLFTGYATAFKNNRAYLYLQEAISLFELVQTDQLSQYELRRHSRLQKVLYITEAATLALHGPFGQAPRASPPNGIGSSMIVSDAQSSPLGGNTNNSVIATDLSTQVCTSYSQTTISALMSEPPDADSTRLNLYLHENRFVRILIADSVITRQWRLSMELLWLLKNSNASTSSPYVQCSSLQQRDSTISRHTTTSVIQHISRCISMPLSTLPPQDLRLVSLAKLPSLTQNIYAFSKLVGETAQIACQSLLSALITVIARADLEGVYLPSVSNLIIAGTCGPTIKSLSFVTEREHDLTIDEERDGTIGCYSQPFNAYPQDAVNDQLFHGGQDSFLFL